MTQVDSPSTSRTRWYQNIVLWFDTSAGYREEFIDRRAVKWLGVIWGLHPVPARVYGDRRRRPA